MDEEAGFRDGERLLSPRWSGANMIVNTLPGVASKRVVAKLDFDHNYRLLWHELTSKLLGRISLEQHQWPWNCLTRSTETLPSSSWGASFWLLASTSTSPSKLCDPLVAQQLIFPSRTKGDLDLETCQPSMSLQSLPYDVILSIVQHLDYPDVKSLQDVRKPQSLIKQRI